MKIAHVKHTLVIGFAMFAMFFGAGNLIFPPFLGLISGTHWFLGFLCFMMIDIGLSVLALLLIAYIGKGAEGLTEKLGAKFSLLLLSLNAICLGPLIAIPRTAATAYEFSIAPFFPAFSSRVFSIFFFAVVILFCLKQSKVIDIIGTFFAPLILLALLYLILKGILSPLGTIEVSSSAYTAVKEGMNAGYQTMDVMAAMVFSSSLLFAIAQKGYRSKETQFRMVLVSGLLAAFILFVVYGGLAYLGASVSASYPPDVDRVALLIAIVRSILGKNGTILLGILVCAACLTPAIGLLSSSASFFETQTRGKISYRFFVITFAALSCIISTFGIENILVLASPILTTLYPVLILLLFLGLFNKQITDVKIYRFAALGIFCVSIWSTLSFFIPHK